MRHNEGTLAFSDSFEAASGIDMEVRRSLFSGRGPESITAPISAAIQSNLQLWWNEATEPIDLDVALEALRPQCIAFLVRRGSNAAQAEDSYSEASVKVLQALRRGTAIPRRRFRSFFYRTLVTTWLMSIRHLRRECVEAAPAPEAADISQPEWISEAVRTIPDCIAALPLPLGDLVRHRYWEGQPFSLYATQNGMNAVEVSRLHTRALTRLFECLRKKGIELPHLPTRQGMRDAARRRQP